MLLSTKCCNLWVYHNFPSLPGRCLLWDPAESAPQSRMAADQGVSELSVRWRRCNEGPMPPHPGNGKEGKDMQPIFMIIPTFMQPQTRFILQLGYSVMSMSRIFLSVAMLFISGVQVPRNLWPTTSENFWSGQEADGVRATKMELVFEPSGDGKLIMIVNR